MFGGYCSRGLEEKEPFKGLDVLMDPVASGKLPDCRGLFFYKNLKDLGCLDGSVG